MSVNLAQPIPWKTFKKLSMDIQKEYVLRLIRQYGANASDLSKVFGVTSTTVSAYCKDNDFGVNFRCGAKMPEHRRAAFARFLEGEENESSPKIAPGEQEECAAEGEQWLEPESEMVVPDEQEPLLNKGETKSGGLERFRLEFSAGSNLEGIFNSIRCIVGGREDLHITVEGVFNT